jgi:predicted phosphodiesterase
MRLAILSDIHGNLPALEAVLEEVRRHTVDGILVAGDTVGGPQQRQAIRLLRSLGSWMIQGNNERYLQDYDGGNIPEAQRHSLQWAAMRWMYHHLDRETLDFVMALPEERVIALEGTAPIRVVHGSPRNLSEGLFPDRDPVKLCLFKKAGFLSDGRQPPRLDRVLQQIAEPVLVCGHTHIPWQQREGSQMVLNPGSVGASIDGDVRAQYALLTWQGGRWQAEQRMVPYDLERIRAAFAESGFLQRGGGFARACLRGIETGQNVPGFLVAHAYTLAAEAGFEGCRVVPDAIWEQAVATFDWESWAYGGQQV